MTNSILNAHAPMNIDPNPSDKDSVVFANTKGIPTLSLFSGAGGLDIGFLQAGFDIRGCVEIESTYCKTLEDNVGAKEGYSRDTVIYCNDIRQFDVSQYKNSGIECVIGGPPCQTFSAAGRRSGGVIGLEDGRGQLFKSYCRILEVINPRIFVFENVYGLPGANGGEPWKQICEAFSSLGYRLTWEVLDAADYGVPQHRERLIMVGTKTGEFSFPLPTHGPDSKLAIPLVSVAAAIEDLQDHSEKYYATLGGLYGHLLPLVPEGLNYSYFTSEMGHPEPVFAWRSKFHDLLYKADRNSPCRTIKAQPGKFTGPFHWKNRHFTIEELKRLQSFPDNYKISGGYGKVLEQIGNSVPPRLAYVIAMSVKEQLLEKSNTLMFETRSGDFISTFRTRQREKSKHFKAVAAKAIDKIYNGVDKDVRKSKSRGRTQYSISPANLFDRTRILSDAKSKQKYNIKISELNSHIEMEFRSINHVGPAVSVLNISGLKKYLPDYDTLTCISYLSEEVDIFHLWASIEEILVERSKFFTLIDIYGHYANRGDVVKIDAEWNIGNNNNSIKIINFFSRTENCGIISDVANFSARIGISEIEFVESVSVLREIRFDLRTFLTHPIIGKDKTLCTYPFPLLSSRALVESKILLNNFHEMAQERQMVVFG
jgi:DNA (cytosine-5)-methyltransferase 1